MLPTHTIVVILLHTSSTAFIVSQFINYSMFCSTVTVLFRLIFQSLGFGSHGEMQKYILVRWFNRASVEDSTSSKGKVVSQMFELAGAELSI